MASEITLFSDDKDWRQDRWTALDAGAGSTERGGARTAYIIADARTTLHLVSIFGVSPSLVPSDWDQAAPGATMLPHAAPTGLVATDRGDLKLKSFFGEAVSGSDDIMFVTSAGDGRGDLAERISEGNVLLADSRGRGPLGSMSGDGWIWVGNTGSGGGASVGLSYVMFEASLSPNYYDFDLTVNGVDAPAKKAILRLGDAAEYAGTESGGNVLGRGVPFSYKILVPVPGTHPGLALPSLSFESHDMGDRPAAKFSTSQLISSFEFATTANLSRGWGSYKVTRGARATNTQGRPVALGLGDRLNVHMYPGFNGTESNVTAKLEVSGGTTVRISCPKYRTVDQFGNDRDDYHPALRNDLKYWEYVPNDGYIVKIRDKRESELGVYIDEHVILPDQEIVVVGVPPEIGTDGTATAENEAASGSVLEFYPLKTSYDGGRYSPSRGRYAIGINVVSTTTYLLGVF